MTAALESIATDMEYLCFILSVLTIVVIFKNMGGKR